MNHDIPRCSQDIFPDVLMVSPDVLNTPRCAEDPQCTEHTLYRVKITLVRAVLSSLSLVSDCAKFLKIKE